MINTPASTDSVEQAVYELIATSILDAVPDDKLDAFDKALAEGDESFDAFLVEYIPQLDDILENLMNRLALPKNAQ